MLPARGTRSRTKRIQYKLSLETFNGARHAASFRCSFKDVDLYSRSMKNPQRVLSRGLMSGVSQTGEHKGKASTSLSNCVE